MSVLFVLIGFSLLLAVVFLAAFIVSIKRGQFDDEYTPGVRILFDDTTASNSSTSQKARHGN